MPMRRTTPRTTEHTVNNETTHICEECGTGWNTLTAANECAIIDATEARQTRAAHTKRKPWDDGIIRGYN